jgi:hypothetical protein
VAATTGRLRLDLDLDLSATPIQGTLARADGSAQTFYGWMQLSQVIEDALEKARGDVEDPP